jgi:DNA-directed RNA polymerase specialized sigma24 family protein
MNDHEALTDVVCRAQAGDLEAYGRVVQATQVMVHALARGGLRDSSLAEDAAQEAYLRAFRRLGDLGEPSAFITWLRRIVITVALNMRRRRRLTLLCLDDVPEVPVLDEAETRWSEYPTRTAGDGSLPDRRHPQDPGGASRLAARVALEVRAAIGPARGGGPCSASHLRPIHQVAGIRKHMGPIT